jgi:hypothetical protein
MITTSASPRSIVSVSGTINLLFPHTQSISIYYVLSTGSEQDLQLPVQSVPITTNMSLNPVMASCAQYNIIYLLTGYEGIASLL